MFAYQVIHRSVCATRILESQPQSLCCSQQLLPDQVMVTVMQLMRQFIVGINNRGEKQNVMKRTKWYTIGHNTPFVKYCISRKNSLAVCPFLTSSVSWTLLYCLTPSSHMRIWIFILPCRTECSLWANTKSDQCSNTPIKDSWAASQEHIIHPVSRPQHLG